MRAKKIFGSILLFLGSLPVWLTLMGIGFPYIIAGMHSLQNGQNHLLTQILYFWQNHFELVLLLGFALIGISLLLLFSATIKPAAVTNHAVPPFPYAPLPPKPDTYAAVGTPNPVSLPSHRDSIPPYHNAAPTVTPCPVDPLPVPIPAPSTGYDYVPNSTQSPPYIPSHADRNVGIAPIPKPAPRIVSTMGKKSRL